MCAILVAFLARGVNGMATWGFWEWFGYGVFAISALMLTADTAIAQLPNLRLHMPRLFIGSWGYLPALGLLISLAAFAYPIFRPTSILALPANAETGSPFGLVQAWGVDRDVLYMIVRPDKALASNKLHRLMLVVRPGYANIDPITDTSIKKSQAYTIQDGFMTLALPTNGVAMWPLPTDRPVQLQFTLVDLPAMFSPDQILSLGDVERMGGKILASTATVTQATAATTTASASTAACPPPFPATQK
jgi:hypothetical protein